MTWFWLKILDLLKPIYNWQGVDFNQLRAIVGIKLEMDNRRAPSFKMNQTEKQHSGAFLLALFLYIVFGAFISGIIAYVPSIVFSFSIYHSYLMVMVTLTIISDFSAVLLDTSDNTIVLPRPITPKTFYAARTTHILLYIGQISFALAIVPIAVTFFVYGPIVGTATIFTSILTIVFSVAITNGVYLLLMRFTSEERLKSIINYFQIGMAVLMMGGYQILPRMLSSKNLENVATDLHWWALLIPPMWMTGLIKLANDLSADWIYWATSLLALAVPIGGWKAINKYLTPYFTTKLADLGTSSVPQFQEKNEESKKSFLSSLTKWIVKPGLESAAFSLVTKAFSRDRKLKLRIYPAIGSFVIIAIVLLMQSTQKGDLSVMDYIQSLQGTEKHLIVIYACIYVLIAASFEINFTDEFKASWVYLSAPIKKPGEILTGTLKAILMKFFLPIYGFTSIIVLLIWREKAVVDLFFGMQACIFLMIIMAIIAEKYLPLSMAPTARNQGGSIARAIITMMIIGVVATGHYFLTKFDFLLWLACPAVMACCYFVLRLYRNIEWKEIRI
jgi:hypothetical protein